MLKILSFIVLIIANTTFAQEIIFYDKDWNECTKEEAAYYRQLLYQESQQIYFAQDFFINAGIQMKGSFLSIDPEIKQGHFTWFYRNGNKSIETTYYKDEIVGAWTKFFEDGEIQEERFYDLNAEYYPKYKILFSRSSNRNIQVEDSNGDYEEYNDDSVLIATGKIKNGLREGDWTGYYENGVLHYDEKYKDGILVRGNSWDSIGNKYSYKKIRIDPTPKNSLSSFYSFINRSIYYTDRARRNDIEGKVFIEFIVEKSGKLSNPTIKKGLGYGLDEIAMKAINKSKPWNPGQIRGRLVRVRMILPITFKLE